MGNLTAIIAADTTGFKRSVEEAKKILEQFTQKEGEATKQIKEAANVSDSQVKSFERVTKVMTKVGSGAMSTAQAEKVLSKEVKELRIQYANLSDKAKESDFGKALQMSCEKAQKHLKELQSQLRAVGDEVQNTTNKAKGLKIGDVMGAAGLGTFVNPYTAILAGVGALAATIKHGIEVNKEFEKSQSVLQAVTGKSAKELEGLTNQAKELGAKTQYTASEIAGLQIELAKLGFTAEEIFNMTPHVQNFATAVGTDLAGAASLAGAALRQFGLDSTETQRITDVMAAACSKSALSYDYLNTAMSAIAPVAASFGFSIEDTVSLLGMLANAGFDASTAASSCRSILLNLADSSGDLAKQLGRPVKNSTELYQALSELQAKGIDLNEALQLTDKRSVAAFNTFMKTAEGGKELTEALYNCSGEAQRMSDVMSDNLEGDLASLGSAWDGLMMAFGDGQGVIRKLVQALTTLITKLSESITAIKDWATELYDNSTAVRATCETLVLSFKNTFETIKYIVQRAVNDISGFFKVIGKVLEGDFSGAVDEWKKMLNEDMDNTKKYLKNLKGNYSEAYDAIKRKREKTLEGNEKDKPTVTTTPDTTPTTTRNGGKGGKETKKKEKTITINTKVEPIKIGETEKQLRDQLRDLKSKIENTPEGALRIKLQAEYKELEDKLKNFGKDPIRVQLEVDASNIDLSGVQNQKTPIVNINKDDIEDGYEGLVGILGVSESLYDTWHNLDDRLENMSDGEKFFAVADAIVSSIDAMNQLYESIQSIIGLIKLFESVSETTSKKKIALNAAETASEETKTAVSTKSAAANIFAAHSKIPFAGVAIAVGLIAAMMATLGKFANGGIVKGATTIGDYNLARVNSGEMILNGRQQSNLFKALDSGGLGNPSFSGGDVQFKIQGKDLVGVLSNYNKKIGKVL